MNARQRTLRTTNRNGRLMSILLLLNGAIPALAGEQASSPAQPVTRMPPALHQLMIGCNQEGAIKYLERHFGERIEVVFSGLDRFDPESAKKYDTRCVLRLSRSDDTWAADNIYLYFREGYLVYKCIVPERANPDEVFHREIESGLQHPPNHPGLMEKVHWGQATQPHVGRLPIEDTDEEDEELALAMDGEELPKVRCGIAFEGLPPFIREQGFNVIAFYQNIGPQVLSDDLLLLGFPIGPVAMVSAKYRDPAKAKKSTGFPGVFVIDGTKEYRLGGDRTVRGAAFRLEPGEMTYMWFHVPDFQPYASLQAEFRGLWGADSDDTHVNIRVWDVESPQVPIPEAK